MTTDSADHQINQNINVMRALAALLVFIYHANPNLFAFGYLGVDIFFVVSGFVIQSLLSRKTSTKTLFDFLLDRIWRIYPPMIFIFLMLVPYFITAVGFGEIKRIFEFFLASILSLQNFYLIFSRFEYFSQSLIFDQFLHFWTLGVELQFYLFLGVSFFYFGKNIKYPYILLFFCIFSLAIHLILIFDPLSGHGDRLNFYSVFSRLWEFLAGSIVQIYISKKYKMYYFKPFILAIGLLTIISFFIFDFRYFLRFMIVLCALLMLVWVGYKKHCILIFRPLAWMGLISYSFYIFHQPALVLYRKINLVRELEFLPTMSLFLGILALSWIFYLLFERHHKTRLYRQTNLLLLLVAVMVSTYGVLKTRNAEAAASLRLGYGESILLTGLNERRLFQCLSANKIYSDKRNFFLGSSRLMQTEQIFKRDGDTSFNISLSGLEFNELEEITKMILDKTDIQKLILGIDPWAIVQSPEKPPIATFNCGKSYSVNQWPFVYPFDLEYALLRNAVVKLPDGSLLSQASLKVVPFENLASAVAYKMENVYIAERKIQLFRQLLQNITDRKIDLIIVLTPYHPGSVQLMAERKTLHFEVERAIKEITAEFNIPVHGSFVHPINGCTTTDFIDGLHPNSDCISDLMTGKKDG